MGNGECSSAVRTTARSGVSTEASVNLDRPLCRQREQLCKKPIDDREVSRHAQTPAVEQVARLNVGHRAEPTGRVLERLLTAGYPSRVDGPAQLPRPHDGIRVGYATP